MIASAIMRAGNYCCVVIERRASVWRAVALRHSSATASNAGYNLKILDSNERIRSTWNSVPKYRKASIDRRTLCIDSATLSNDKNMRLDDLSDAQLYAMLVEHGYPACPVTPTTRKVLLKKLEKLVKSRNKGLGEFNGTSVSDHKHQNTPKNTLNLETSFKIHQNSPASNSNLKKWPASSPNLQNSPASSPNLQNSPASSPNLQNSPARTPNLQNSSASTPNLQNSPTRTPNIQNWLASTPNLVHQPQLLFFDIETSGLEVDCDILQISARSGSSTFNSYAQPTQPIAEQASSVNHLYNRDGDLYRDDELLDSRPLRLVLLELCYFLQTFGKKCILVAHNCPFDASRLVNAIKRNSMEDEFAAVVDGFADTLRLFRDKYPERRWRRGALKLTTLVSESLDLPTEGAHDAHYDTLLLEQLTATHFTPQQLLDVKTSFEEALRI